MFWEGFFYIGFYIFFIMVLIPYLPKSLSFNRYYPVAMVTFGLPGILCGILTYRIVKNMPEWVKITIMGGIFLTIIFYLVTHFDRFTIHAH